MLERPDSTILEQKFFSSMVPAKNVQGDWQGYQQQCARFRGNDEIDPCDGNVIAYQRQCALAYLGKRAQFYGGVGCSKQPRIFTPKLLSELERINKTKRFNRYPWLETLLNLLAKIEQLQDQAGSGNVISLVPHRFS